MSTNKNASIGLKTINDFNDDLQLYTRKEMVPKAPLRGSFAVQERADHNCVDEVTASRRDYYKISFISKGSGIFTMGEERYEVDGPTLIFINPFELKTWRATSEEQEGYFCLFTDLLFETQTNHQENLLMHPLLQMGAQAVYKLTDEQCSYIQSIFRQLLREYSENAAFKHEAILIYLKLLLLEGKRLSTQFTSPQRQLTAAQALAHRFTDRLEKQFPIEYTHNQLRLKTAKEFAQVLNTHPNHLNACVKQATGRTVSEHIRQRMLLEARLLLIHTDWQISEIAWCLGFEDPGNFTHFFKNHSGVSPHIYRAQ
ncbi:AraC family transcriptional regulator [Chitinophaga polysaccharea]|uniref:helix-turn-helix transcriptional regulator n=1 Tax=Chitinophaga TaxID=79328 RepID=UPI0014556AC1|nr:MULTISPECIES: helix-turn-helix domain-containing protein [Chitinophaga]NLR61491.1 AraC family transcriptional regulator [Chitinophaga polysaccharea]NLU93914.1 AraC family transcriptional regulator [Chitinophaga sp. Ak27]